MKSPDPYVGLLLDEYRLEELLGQGGMASVYRALDIHLNRFVAIKIVASPYQKDHDYLLRFEREARAIAQLEHPHVIRLYRYGEAQGLLYMAMQYIEGTDLERIIDSYRKTGDYMEMEDILRITREITSALDYIHGRGVIHRDVKSSNIMLDMNGRAILTDFGLVLRMQSGTRGEVFGSPHYLAPEQAISSAQAVPQSDLYSLGIILFEMFTGKFPFDAPDPLDVAMLHIQQAAPLPRSFRPELNRGIENVILKTIAKKPEDRFPTGKDLADALERAVNLSASPTETISLPKQTTKTIPERIALDSQRQQLPPLPRQSPPSPQQKVPSSPPQARQGPSLDAVLNAASQEKSQPAERTPAAVPGKLNKNVTCLVPALLLAAAFSLLFCIFLITAAQKIGELVQSSSPTESITEEPEDIFARNIPTRTSVPVAVSTSTQDAPVLVPTTKPAQTKVIPAEYHLEIDRCQRGRCLVILNTGTADIPLDPLQLKAKKAVIEGSDWEIEALGANECILFSEDDGNLPDGVSCEIVETIEIDDDDDSLLKNDLEVIFDSQTLWKCKEGMLSCRYTIPVP